jgi:hypothetical protein
VGLIGYPFAQLQILCDPIIQGIKSAHAVKVLVYSSVWSANMPEENSDSSAGILEHQRASSKTDTVTVDSVSKHPVSVLESDEGPIRMELNGSFRIADGFHLGLEIAPDTR